MACPVDLGWDRCDMYMHAYMCLLRFVCVCVSVAVSVLLNVSA